MESDNFRKWVIAAHLVANQNFSDAAIRNEFLLIGIVLLFSSLIAPNTVLSFVCKFAMTALVSFSTIQFQIPLNGESLFAFAAAS